MESLNKCKCGSDNVRFVVIKKEYKDINFKKMWTDRSIKIQCYDCNNKAYHQHASMREMITDWNNKNPKTNQ